MRMRRYVHPGPALSDVIQRHLGHLDEYLKTVELHLAAAEVDALGAESGKARAWIVEDDLGEIVGALVASEKQWESSHFGCRFEQLSVYRKPGYSDSPASTTDGLLSAWLSESRALGGYATIRVDTRDIDIVRCLESGGFRTLAPMVTLMRSAADSEPSTPPQPAKGITVGPCDEAEMREVTAIARDAFIYGRFWTEPALNRDTARAMHGEWALNCCRKLQADEVFVARRDGKLLGFNAVRVRTYGGVDYGEINLIAVDPNARGTGIGRLLVDAGNEWLEERVGRLVVRTEAPNTAAIRLYERTGFLTAGTTTYLGMFLS